METRSLQSPVSGVARDATSKQTVKRQPDATSESDSLPARRPRLTQSIQPTGAEGKGQAGNGVQTAGQHPEPEPRSFMRRDTSIPEPGIERQDEVSQAMQLRKRRIDSDGDDNGHQLKRAPLSRKNLALFNKMERKKASNKVSMRLNSTNESITTMTTSTTTSGFAIQAYKNGILEPRHSKPPTNVEDIHKRHTRSRETASPSESRFEHYVNRVNISCNEMTMAVEVSRHMLKDFDDKGYRQAFNQAFTGFPKDVGFNGGLSAP